MRRYVTEKNLLREVTDFRPGAWVNLVNPSLEECLLVAREFQVDIADIRAALDDEESSRVDVSNDYTLILFDIPSIEYRHKREAYTTIPLGLIFAGDTLILIKKLCDHPTASKKIRIFDQIGWLQNQPFFDLFCQCIDPRQPHKWNMLTAF